jgi:hypothetical protein
MFECSTEVKPCNKRAIKLARSDSKYRPNNGSLKNKAVIEIKGGETADPYRVRLWK